jgi:hypothetical protein
MILDNLNPNYFSGQGQILIAKLLTPFGVPGPFFLSGNAPKFEFKPTMERRKHKESQSGGRLIDKVQTQTKGGTLEMTVEDIRKDVMALNMSGKKVTLASGSYTSGSPDTAPTTLASATTGSSRARTSPRSSLRTRRAPRPRSPRALTTSCATRSTASSKSSASRASRSPSRPSTSTARPT